ncbi:MAG TPA: hypothetical protein VGJ95_01995, partial [Pseudonocardiaceae bacterium]
MIKRLGILLAAAAMLLVAACGGGGAAGNSTVKVAAVAAGPFVKVFNPLLVDVGTQSGNAANAIFEPLLM